MSPLFHHTFPSAESSILFNYINCERVSKTKVNIVTEIMIQLKTVRVKVYLIQWVEVLSVYWTLFSTIIGRPTTDYCHNQRHQI